MEAVKNGIAKINVGTEIRQTYEKALKEKPVDTGYAQRKLEQNLTQLICDYYYIKNSIQKLGN